MTDQYHYKSTSRFPESNPKEIKEENEKEYNNEKNNVQDEKLHEYMRQLLAERSIINEEECPFAYRFIDEEIGRVQQKLVKGPPRDTKYIDVYHEKPVKIVVKVLVPVKEHPRFNFIGKLLGPKGNTLKQLQEETMCYMNICGRGSMRDREKEDELRQSLEPKYSHLSDDLHIEISTIAAPAEAHTRIASALTHIRKYLIPEHRMMDMGERTLLPRRSILGKKILRDKEWQMVPRKDLNEDEVEHVSVRKIPVTSRPGPRPVVSSKSTVMSILNKARIAMQESYGYEERQTFNFSEYNDYEDINYHPKAKRYFEGNSSYGKDIHDVEYKKRKI